MEAIWSRKLRAGLLLRIGKRAWRGVWETGLELLGRIGGTGLGCELDLGGFWSIRVQAAWVTDWAFGPGVRLGPDKAKTTGLSSFSSKISIVIFFFLSLFLYFKNINFPTN